MKIRSEFRFSLTPFIRRWLKTELLNKAQNTCKLSQQQPPNNSNQNKRKLFKGKWILKRIPSTVADTWPGIHATTEHSIYFTSVL